MASSPRKTRTLRSHFCNPLAWGAGLPAPAWAAGDLPEAWNLWVVLLLALVVAQALWLLRVQQQNRIKTRAQHQALRSLNQARREAQERHDQLDAIASRVPGLVYQFLLRPDGSSCFPYASEAMANIYRCTPQQVRESAQAVFDVLHPDDVARVVESIRASARALTPWQCEYRVRFADGTERWLYGNALPSRHDDGGVLWHGFITDITERRAADERLRQFSRIIEQAPIGVMITDLQGTITYTNPWLSAMTGYTGEDLLGRTPRLLHSGQTPKAVHESLWQTLLQGNTWTGELINRRRDGSVYVEQAVIAPVLDAQGLPSHYVALKEDITQRTQADQALKASLQEKVALLNEVHHRVKNNLQIITSLLRLEGRRSPDANTQATLRDMQARILAMALLHEGLYRSGLFASVNLGNYLQQLTSQVLRAQARAGQEVRLVLALKPAHVSLEVATPCGLLVNELLTNCLKHAFTEGGGTVWVCSQPAQTSGRWCVGVRDDGRGLPADFELGRQASLGLRLAVDLAAQLGGELRVRSGPGADVWVEFPLHPPEHDARTQHLPQVLPPG